jgi:predicted phage terminase large subunit-like protein
MESFNPEWLRLELETDHLSFTRYFFKARHNIKFRVNWHHVYIADIIEDVIQGRRKNVIINVSPGSSKTESAVINFIARGLAINPRCRFLHLSYSDELALLNSQQTRDLIRSDEYQQFWPLKIADDSKAKGRWNVIVDDKPAGGVYATSISGQVTGFRAGHMEQGFNGAIIIDDPLKPEDAYSETKLNAANRKLLTTVQSRKANPETPIIMIMQRIAANDPTGFIEGGNLGKDWTFVKIPAVIDDLYVNSLDAKYQSMIERDAADRFSYWPYKEPIETLLTMERGEGTDLTGARVSRHVFNSQYQQSPKAVGGNLIRGEWFDRYTVLPKIKYRRIYVDTAQKTKERNDRSVFECWGLGTDNKAYLLDILKGKWEAPELERRCIEFWNKHKAFDIEHFGQLQRMYVEDKSSGTGLIQKIKTMNHIPIFPIERTIDKLTRLMDGQSYIEAHCLSVPSDAHFTNDFISECEAFTADDSHEYDDQIDPMLDMIKDMLCNNKLALWEKLI